MVISSVVASSCNTILNTAHAEPFLAPVCRMAMISDQDGNTICIHKRNPANF
jgi:hypothetical protein